MAGRAYPPPPARRGYFTSGYNAAAPEQQQQYQQQQHQHQQRFPPPPAKRARPDSRPRGGGGGGRQPGNTRFNDDGIEEDYSSCYADTSYGNPNNYEDNSGAYGDDQGYGNAEDYGNAKDYDGGSGNSNRYGRGSSYNYSISAGRGNGKGVGGYDSRVTDRRGTDFRSEYGNRYESGQPNRPGGYSVRGGQGQQQQPGRGGGWDRGGGGGSFGATARFGGRGGEIESDMSRGGDRNFGHGSSRGLGNRGGRGSFGESGFNSGARDLGVGGASGRGALNRNFPARGEGSSGDWRPSDSGGFRESERFGDEGRYYDDGRFGGDNRHYDDGGRFGDDDYYDHDGYDGRFGDEGGYGDDDDEYYGGGRFNDRGRFDDTGRSSRPAARKHQPLPPSIKISPEQQGRIDDAAIKQLVTPKPPHRILKEMIGEESVSFEYIENPPLPPGIVESRLMHTLKTTIDGDSSSGTGPSHEIAKNICSENAIMGVVTRRYEAMNKMVAEGIKTKVDLLSEDPTPFELAGVAIFKMLNEWEAKGYQLPADLEDALYTAHLAQPVSQQLASLRAASSLPATLVPSREGAAVIKKTGMMKMFSAEELRAKNPVALLHELRGGLEYVCLGAWGTAPNQTFTMSLTVDGEHFNGTGPNKKEAKRLCAIDVLTRLYNLPIPVDD